MLFEYLTIVFDMIPLYHDKELLIYSKIKLQTNLFFQYVLHHGIRLKVPDRICFMHLINFDPGMQ